MPKWKLIFLGLCIITVPFLILITNGLFPPRKVIQPEARPKPVRQLIGIFKLPANGERVSQDEQGQDLLYREGEVVRYTQLTSPLSAYVIDPRSIGHPAYTVTSRFYVTANAPADGKVELRAAGERTLLVQVEIIPRRSRRR